MSNPFFTDHNTSQEDIAAFPDALTQGLSDTETKYTLGNTEDDPEQVNVQRIQDNAEINVSRQTADINATIAQIDSDNPFLNAESESNLDKGIQSLESIVEDLEEVMVDTSVNRRSTDFVVDVQLDDESKELLDNDINDVIQTAPDQFESLESIVLCNERSVPVILGILKAKHNDLMK